MERSTFVKRKLKNKYVYKYIIIIMSCHKHGYH